jgi:polyphosphate glucokinase
MSQQAQVNGSRKAQAGGKTAVDRRSAASRGRLGIDVGGTGIKGAPVEVRTGKLLHDRHRVLTPHPSTPDAVAETVAEVADAFDTTGPVGCTFPGVIRDGVARTAAHLGAEWIGTSVRDLLQERLGRPVTVVNDADAAGMAEMAFGAGRGRKGLVVMVTVGTGIGTALFHDGVMIPNTELGHLEVRGKDADTYASDATRDAKGLSWKRWAKRLDRYLEQLEKVLSPEVVIIGGGVSRHPERFLPSLRRSCEVVPAMLDNTAGIVGAALASARATSTRATSAGRARR